MKRFIRDKVDATPIVDNVFAIVNKAIEAKKIWGEHGVVDATIGSLYGEDGRLVAFDSVFTHYNEMDNTVKAKYASSFNGNIEYREAAYAWLMQETHTTLAHSVVATPGGSGAISTTFVDVLDVGDSVVIPDIAWGSYKLMASMNNLGVRTYSLFEGDHFNVADVARVCSEVMQAQGKVLLVINDPCHNPTGYSLTQEEWSQVIEVLNHLSKEGPVILLNDIAYIDFAYDFKASRKYIETFNAISDNILVVVAFSCSKTLTSYGLRCGAALILGQTSESVRELEIVMEKSARATWSNVPNAAMENFVYVVGEGRDAFEIEKNKYVELLATRSDIFLREAKACGLDHYPYKEGFFVTLRVEDDKVLSKFHTALIEEKIFTVKVSKGIRVALCSLSVDKCRGLAPRMKGIFTSIV